MQDLIAILRSQLDLFKDVMIKTKDRAVCPTAMLLQPNGEQFMIVMEWHNDEEAEICLARLCGVVAQAQILAVVLTCAANVMVTKTNTMEKVLMSTLYVPTQKPFSLGYKYEMVENEPVFGDEVSSADLEISPYQIPDLWPGIAGSGTVH